MSGGAAPSFSPVTGAPNRPGRALVRISGGDEPARLCVPETRHNHTLSAPALSIISKSICYNEHTEILVLIIIRQAMQFGCGFFEQANKARRSGLNDMTVKNRWSGRRDSNPRPQRPKRCALPDCATPRSNYFESYARPTGLSNAVCARQDALPQSACACRNAPGG